MTRRRCAWLAAAVLAAGCTVPVRVPPPAVDWAARESAVRAWPGWEARGRLALKSGDGGGQADFTWRQQADDTRIRVSGPFGAGAYEIAWNPASLAIRSRDGEFSERYDGPDAAERFLAARLGWSFPAFGTRWWLLGLADPAWPASTVFAADGRLASLEQNGWRVTYERWLEVRGQWLPARLTAESPQARLRLVVDQWLE